ncbi:flavodoxin [Brevibacillus dissolubilis]|uniref:flavodoxin n=1 Tax=Brevibacillus dissolubilis TaxID=1844116 RepID=UPI00111713E0|nr:flavodoxin [Brevibacillus dissolubilis]
MAKLIMIYASMTGNTEEMAELIASAVRESNLDIEVKDVMSAKASDLNDYDGIILGAYTWGDGELPDEFLDFYEELDSISLLGKKVAVFGSCDSAYEHYGAAVDILIHKARELEAEVVLEGLKVELSPDGDDQLRCQQFGQAFATYFLN